MRTRLLKFKAGVCGRVMENYEFNWSGLNMAESSGTFRNDGESFGQRRPPLYEMIKNILREYPSGQIFKVSSDIT